MTIQIIDHTLADSRKAELAKLIADESKCGSDEFNPLEEDLIRSLSQFGKQGINDEGDFDEPGDWYGSLYFYVDLYTPQLIDRGCIEFVREWINALPRKCVVEFTFSSFPGRIFEPGMFFMQVVITKDLCWIASDNNSAEITKGILGAFGLLDEVGNLI
jgi:hypothetical protein